MAIQVEQNISLENAIFLRDAFNVSYGAFTYDTIKEISEWLDHLVRAADIRENRKRQKHFQARFGNKFAIRSSIVKNYKLAALCNNTVIFAETREELDISIKKYLDSWKFEPIPELLKSEWQIVEVTTISSNRANKRMRYFHDATPGPYTPRKSK